MATSEQAVDELSPEERRALFRVVRGDPDDEELAALTAVLAAAAASAAAAPDTEPKPASFWLDRQYRHAVRYPMPAPGPGAWKAAFLPR